MILLAAVVTAHGQAQTWGRDFQKARQEAVATHRPILIDFYAEWCGPCKMLEREVFTATRVQALLKKVVCVRLDIDRRPPEAEWFQVSSIPRLVLLAPDGKRILWDAVGFREAGTFVQELSEALGVKASATPPSHGQEPATLTKTRNALQSGRYGQLKATDPAAASKGLSLLVAELGSGTGASFDQRVALLAKSGRDAVPALLAGMGHKRLTVRVTAYRALKKVLGRQAPGNLSFDPWAASGKRSSQLAAWKRWYGQQRVA